MKPCNAFLLIGCLVLLAGCGSVPPTFYYRVDYNVQDAGGDSDGLPYTIGVAQFAADALYESDRIVYRKSPYQAQFYHYRRWVSAPKKIVTERVVQHLSASHLFQRVVRIPASYKIDYVLRGNIHAFEEWDDGDAWYGAVTLGFTLQDATTNEVVWEGEFKHRTRAEKKEPVAVVRAISESLRDVLQECILNLHDHFKENHSN